VVDPAEEKLRRVVLAEVNNIGAALGQVATQAQQPMQQAIAVAMPSA
jgi:hypothetical protein